MRYKGFPESENTWEPRSSFVHGYTTGFRNYLRAPPEVPVSFTDCLCKPDRVIERDGAKAVVVDREAVPPPQIPAHFARNPAPQGSARQEAPGPLQSVHMRAMRGVRCVNEDSQTGSAMAEGLQR